MKPETRLFLICYDVADDKRRRKIYKCLRGFGQHLQFSVFRCPLSPIQLETLRDVLEELVSAREDQVLLIPLGRASNPKVWETLTIGRPVVPYVRAAQVF